MNTRLNFLYLRYFIKNIHYSLSPGHGFLFLFRQKERPPSLGHGFWFFFRTEGMHTLTCMYNIHTYISYIHSFIVYLVQK